MILDQTNTDYIIGIWERSDLILVTFISFSRSQRHFETQLLIEKKLVCNEPMAGILTN